MEAENVRYRIVSTVCGLCGAYSGRVVAVRCGGVRRRLLRHGDVQSGVRARRGGHHEGGALRTHGLGQVRRPAADLGMFSMFGRTGAPQKGGPTKGRFFFHFFATW